MNSSTSQFIQSKSDICDEVFAAVEHVAIIMDGNRRWAKQHGLPVKFGHLKGIEAVENIVEAAVKCGVKVLTLFAFSTENWNRTSEQVNELLDLFTHYIASKTEDLIRNGVRLHAIGDLASLPSQLREVIDQSHRETENGSAIDVVLAINYGGRDEICRAMKKLARECASGNLDVDAIDEDMIAKNLDTAQWKDPDLLIRTSGEARISNFLLWQSSYTEIYISEVLWPDFHETDFFEALKNYQKRQRRKGG
jgi:undecaprenyl diphosphate synthase